MPVSASSVRNTSTNASASRSSPAASASSAASIARLARPIATTAPPASVRAHSIAVTSTSAAGTTRSTSPIASASSARTWRPDQIISLARAGPTSRGRRCVAPPPGMIPSSISGWPRRAVSPATRRSHASASSSPPPSAKPVMAAMTGRGIAATASSASRKLRATVRASSGPPNSSMSAPAASAFSLPHTTTALTVASAAISRAVSASAPSIACDSGLSGGRFRRSTTTPSPPSSRRTYSSMVRAG